MYNYYKQFSKSRKGTPVNVQYTDRLTARRMNLKDSNFRGVNVSDITYKPINWIPYNKTDRDYQSLESSKEKEFPFERRIDFIIEHNIEYPHILEEPEEEIIDPYIDGFCYRILIPSKFWKLFLYFARKVNFQFGKQVRYKVFMALLRRFIIKFNIRHNIRKNVSLLFVDEQILDIYRNGKVSTRDFILNFEQLSDRVKWLGTPCRADQEGFCYLKLFPAHEWHWLSHLFGKDPVIDENFIRHYINYGIGSNVRFVIPDGTSFQVHVVRVNSDEGRHWRRENILRLDEFRGFSIGRLITPDEDGYCYLWFFKPEVWNYAADKFGFCPKITEEFNRFHKGYASEYKLEMEWNNSLMGVGEFYHVRVIDSDRNWNHYYSNKRLIREHMGHFVGLTFLQFSFNIIGIALLPPVLLQAGCAKILARELQFLEHMYLTHMHLLGIFRNAIRKFLNSSRRFVEFFAMIIYLEAAVGSFLLMSSDEQAKILFSCLRKILDIILPFSTHSDSMLGMLRNLKNENGSVMFPVPTNIDLDADEFDDGYCYLSLINKEYHQFAIQLFGENPKVDFNFKQFYYVLIGKSLFDKVDINNLSVQGLLGIIGTQFWYDIYDIRDHFGEHTSFLIHVSRERFGDNVVTYDQFYGVLQDLHPQMVYHIGMRPPSANIDVFAAIKSENVDGGLLRNSNIAQINGDYTKSLADMMMNFPYGGVSKKAFDALNNSFDNRLLYVPRKDHGHGGVKFIDQYYKLSCSRMINKTDTVVLIGPKLKEVIDMAIIKPTATFLSIFGEMNAEDQIRHEENKRLAKRILSMEDNDTYYVFDGIQTSLNKKRKEIPALVINLCHEFLKYLDNKPNTRFFNRSNIANCTHFADLMFAFNNLYDLTPQNLSFYLKKFKVATCYASRIACNDLFHLGYSKNEILDVEFQKIGNKIGMTFMNSPSKGYVHAYANIRCWNEYTMFKTSSGYLSYEIINEKFNYELLQISRVKFNDLTKIVAKRNRNTSFVRLIKIMPYIKYGRIEYFYVDRLKFSRIRDFCLRLSMDNFEPSKITTLATSLKNVIIVGDKEIQHAWDVDDQIFYETIMFATVQSSLMRGDLLNCIINGIELSKSGGYHKFFITKKWQELKDILTMKTDYWKILTDINKLVAVPEVLIWEPGTSWELEKKIAKFISGTNFLGLNSKTAKELEMELRLRAEFEKANKKFIIKTTLARCAVAGTLISTVGIWGFPYLTYRLLNRKYNLKGHYTRQVNKIYNLYVEILDWIIQAFERFKDYFAEYHEDINDDVSLSEYDDQYNPLLQALSESLTETSHDTDNSKPTTQDDDDDDDGDNGAGVGLNTSRKVLEDVIDEEVIDEIKRANIKEALNNYEDNKERLTSSLVSDKSENDEENKANGSQSLHGICYSSSCFEHSLGGFGDVNKCASGVRTSLEEGTKCHLCNNKDTLGNSLPKDIKQKGTFNSNLSNNEQIFTPERVAHEFKTFVLSKLPNLPKSIIDCCAGYGALHKPFISTTSNIVAYEIDDSVKNHRDFDSDSAQWFFKDINKVRNLNADLIISNPPWGADINNKENARKVFKTMFRKFKHSLAIIQQPKQIEYIIQNYLDKNYDYHVSKIFKFPIPRTYKYQKYDNFETEAQFLLIIKKDSIDFLKDQVVPQSRKPRRQVRNFRQSHNILSNNRNFTNI